MELKRYQTEVIQDLEDFIEKLNENATVAKAYTDFWKTHRKTPLAPSPDGFIKPYNDAVTGVPHVCFKVPTAGGKTFIACSSLKPIFDGWCHTSRKAVVWLVPSDSILRQTLRNLKNTEHDYRKKIDVDFSSRVEVYDKEELLHGRGFSAESVAQHLSIFVLSIDSLKANNKDALRIHRDNGYLQKFAQSIGAESDEEISLSRILTSLNPVVIIDESHHAISNLSVKMLNELNPSFILDLTATPRENSNIISFVPALELKKANMVKLPVIVNNQNNIDGVIRIAVHLRGQLEARASQAYKNGTAPYIRPIVLFQAQSKTSSNTESFEKLKARLIKAGIKEEEIKIKVSGKDEIGSTDLLSENCKVRYIITVNALKEGWDCPFAYILASLANKSSKIDVEQILGRILRLPNVTRHPDDLLNLSYVFTCSAKFDETLQEIVRGLNAAGFTEKDYRQVASEEVRFPDIDENYGALVVKSPDLFESAPKPVAENPMQDIENLSSNFTLEEPVAQALSVFTANAHKEAAYAETVIKHSFALEQQGAIVVPNEVKNQTMTAHINQAFLDDAKTVMLPQFSVHREADGFWATESDMLFEKDSLLKDFKLGTKAVDDIDFKIAESQTYSIDLDSTKDDATPTPKKLKGNLHDYLMVVFNDPKQTKNRAYHCASVVYQQLGKQDPLSQTDVMKWLERVFEEFDDEQFSDFFNNEWAYCEVIRKKIEAYKTAHIKKAFLLQYDQQIIQTKCYWQFKEEKPIAKRSIAVQKSLYDKEDDINGFELRMIQQVADMDNVVWWTRNVAKKDFCMNGFINHYPDFIIKTAKGNLILLETKGDHLFASDKIELGRLWKERAGEKFSYFLVYETRLCEGSYTPEEFLRIVEKL